MLVTDDGGRSGARCGSRDGRITKRHLRSALIRPLLDLPLLRLSSQPSTLPHLIDAGPPDLFEIGNVVLDGVGRGGDGLLVRGGVGMAAREVAGETGGGGGGEEEEGDEGGGLEHLEDRRFVVWVGKLSCLVVRKEEGNG